MMAEAGILSWTESDQMPYPEFLWAWRRYQDSVREKMEQQQQENLQRRFGVDFSSQLPADIQAALRMKK